ncbi:DUF1385 domain-containing protein [Mailhella massiliensis]|uniref:DUF1385 domain-containing protein n=1 Tax=Mailhella massiliensis TaxID=1903261 RepID=A0A921AWG3_9BACT|nr:DUF1385 domain-containing protein [Mailhella massiliensis]HJD97590.1 DUF1385 domain-containing protein [Mailhella massiliensis]
MKLRFSFLRLLALAGESCALPLVGGQAVMEGVLMRNGASCALAVRRPSGTIAVESRLWRSVGPKGLRAVRFLRGFPVLVESLANGIRALNRSADLSGDEDSGPMTRGEVALTLLMAFGAAVALFVAAPHLLALFMQYLGLSGGMQGFSFHIWDGIFKFLMFIGYIAAISFLPEIRRVFQYHGAEHKTIHAFEKGGMVTVETARRGSRLHPRCGTTFLLFVLCVSIVLHAVLVPLLLMVWEPSSAMLRHAGIVLFKILLILPVSALAYELIRYAAALEDGFWGRLLRAPGFFLQLLTTREPDDRQLEVAVAALREALGPESPFAGRFESPDPTVME